MFGSFPLKKWYLYDTTDGRVILKHPFKKGMDIPCPYCGQNLNIVDFWAQCCDQLFTTGFWEVHQNNPFGHHSKKSGRGWQSLRPYKVTD